MKIVFYPDEKIVVPSQIPSGDVKNYGASSPGKYQLSSVDGRLSGVVKIGCTALPFADVQIWGDWDRWQGYDMFSSTINECKNTGSPTNGRIRTKSDGTFDLIGLSSGNIIIAVFSDLIGIQYIYNYNGDWNARDAMASNGFRTGLTNTNSPLPGNDVRVSISTESPMDNLQAGWIVYTSSGEMMPSHLFNNSFNNPIEINIPVSAEGTCTITGKIKFLEAAAEFADKPIKIIAREEFQGDWSTHQSKSRFYLIPAKTCNKGDEISYTISVSSGEQYHVDIKSEYLGIVNRFDTQADFSNFDYSNIELRTKVLMQ